MGNEIGTGRNQSSRFRSQTTGVSSCWGNSGNQHRSCSYLRDKRTGVVSHQSLGDSCRGVSVPPSFLACICDWHLGGPLVWCTRDWYNSPYHYIPLQCKSTRTSSLLVCFVHCWTPSLKSVMTHYGYSLNIDWMNEKHPWPLARLLLLLLSRFSHVRLSATLETAAHQAPPSLGFSRQEHWSGLPFASPMHESENWKWSRSVVSSS